jgi:hypothetical protein
MTHNDAASRHPQPAYRDRERPEQVQRQADQSAAAARQSERDQVEEHAAPNPEEK